MNSSARLPSLSPLSNLSLKYCIGFGAVWLVVVLPLTMFGYGSSGDAWKVSGTATRLYTTGQYVPSRTWGFPLYEFAVTPLVAWGGALLSNQLSVLGGLAILAVLFYLAKIGELRHPKTVVAAIAFLPIVLKNASMTIDFIPALALLWWSYAMYRRDRLNLAAIFLGIACGFRPSSIVFMLPLLVGALCRRDSPRRIIMAGFFTGVTAAAAYSPVLITFGLNYLLVVSKALKDNLPANTSDNGVTIVGMGYRALTFLGVLQTVIIVTLLVWSIIGKKTRAEWETSVSRQDVAFHACNLFIWIVCFVFVHSYKSEYLFPLLISFAVVLDCVPTNRLRVACCAVALSGNIIALGVIGGESGERKLHLSLKPGYTFHEVQVRRWYLSLREAATIARFDKPTVLLNCGHTWIPVANPRWIEDETTGLFRQIDGQLYVSAPIFDEDRLRWFVNRGFRLVAWNGAKSECMGLARWRDYIEVFPSLEAFFNQPLCGEPEQ